MNSIRLTSQQYDDIRDHVLADELEGAVFLIAGYFENEYGKHFTVNTVVVPDDDDYDVKSSYRLELSSKFFNKVISCASAKNMTIIQCHSHPTSHQTLQYSSADYHGELLSASTIHGCLGKPMGSLLFGPNKIIGRIWLPKHRNPVPIDQLRLVDRRLQIHELGEKKRININKEVYDRQIKAFGEKGQSLLSRLCVGIVGVGGTGSSVAEQLAREGVQTFVLADHDKFSPSNITRMYGSYHKMRSKYKVSIVKNNIKKIRPDAKIIALSKNIMSQQVLTSFKNCDIIFSCVDRHAPRSVLNELAHQYFIPVIDMGVGIAVRDNKITEANIQVGLSSPSLPCLYCTNMINSERISAESMSEGDLKCQRNQGYIMGLQDDEPSVIPLTTMAASSAIIMLKDLLFGVMETRSSAFILDVTTFKKLQIAALVKNNCVCTTRIARADYYPLSAP